MADDDPQILSVLSKDLGRPLRHEIMAGSMEAVAADLVFLIVFIGKAVQIGLFRHGLMERRIEHHRHGHAGHDRLAGADADQVGRIVQRRKVAAGLDPLNHLFVHQDGAGEALSAVHHTVSHRVDLGKGADHAHLRIRELFDHQLHSRRVIRHIRHFLHLFPARRLMGDVASVDADPLAQSLRQNRLRIAVDELIL